MIQGGPLGHHCCAQMDEMESLRIEGELEKQQALRSPWDQRDSGLADMEATGEGNGGGSTLLAQSPCLKRSALSNSLLDLHDQREYGMRTLS